MTSSPLPRRALALLASLAAVAPALAGADALTPVVLAPPVVPWQPGPLLSARGIAAYNRGDLVTATRLLRRAVALSPQDVIARHHLGLALIRRGEVSAGRRQLAAAVREAGDELKGAVGARLLADLGRAYLVEGNAAWATRALRRAVGLSPADGRLRYLLGVALLRLDQHDEALEAFAAAGRAKRGVDRQALAVQAGLAHYGAGRWASARRAVQHVLLSDRHGGVARRLTRATHESEGRGASVLAATLSTGGLVDTNPLYEHEANGPTAVGLSLDGRLVWRPWAGTRRIVSGELGAGRVFYFPAGTEAEGGTDVTHASRTDLGAGVRLATALSLRGRRAWLAVGYRFGLTLLDAPSGLSSSPTLVDDSHIFSERHGGALSLAVSHDGGSDVLSADGQALTTIRLGFARQAFADLPRSHLASELLVEHGRDLHRGRLRLLGWVGLRHEHADSSDYHALVPGVGAGASYLGPWRVVLGVRLGYEYQDHYESGTSGRWGDVRRRDHTLAGTLEVSRALPWGLRLTLVYQRLQKLSTVTSFDYGRDLLSLALAWSHD